MPNLPSAGKAVSMKLQPSVTGFLLDKLTVLTPEIGSSLPFHVANSHEPSTAPRIAPHVTARFAGSDVGRLDSISRAQRLVKAVYPDTVNTRFNDACWVDRGGRMAGTTPSAMPNDGDG